MLKRRAGLLELDERLGLFYAKLAQDSELGGLRYSPNFDGTSAAVWS